jgi:protein-S-isoprenylcysteine O-methyltransferase Ste14
MLGQEATWEIIVKTGSKLAIAVFVLVAISHLLRVLFAVTVTIDTWIVPQWISILGIFVPGIIAWLLWRENR